MSAICTEFVQNAWKKDLCSNCFKAKADHASPKGADSGGARELPDDVGKTSPVKKAPNETYASSKQTIMEMHKSMVASVVGKSLSSLNHKNNVLNHNNNNNSSSSRAANNNHSASNGVTSGRYVKNTASPRKIGSSGVHLWEVGQMPDQSHPDVTVVVSNGVNGKDPPSKDDVVDAGSSNGNRVSAPEGQGVSGILKDAKPVKLLQVTSNGQQGRRGSVGFLEGSPKVIGYGGDDYDWGDDPESSEEPSDVDSLENYDLTDEDRAFSQLTDRNTEYNADNTNLLLHQPAKALVTSSSKSTSLVDKLSPQSFYSMPTSRASSSSDRAKNFVRSKMSNGTKEPATFLDDDDEEEDEDDGTMIVKLLPDPDPSPNPMASRAGCETIPSRKYPSVARASVQQLFSEEPVTAAELRAASEKLRPFDAGIRPETESPLPSEVLPIRDRNGPESECSPYGVTRLADIAKDNVEPEVASSSPPVIPKCPPPAADDEAQKWPVLSKNTTPTHSVRAPTGNLPSGKPAPILGSLAHDQKVVTSAPLPSVAKEEPCGSPKSTIGICSTFQSPAHKDPDAKFRNREYAAVNYSCHYASSYIKTGVGLQPNSTSGPDRAALSPSSTLPPTPLTNPYSSTAILKGLPRQQSSPEHSPQKPPVTKPKPKLLVKPPTSPKIPEGGFQVPGIEPVKEDSLAKNSNRNMDSTGANAEIEDGSSVVSTSLTENVSDGQVSPEVDGEPPQPGAGFDSKVTALTNALDLNKRGPKRQAPRPPTAFSQDTPASKGDDKASVTSFPLYASVANGEPQASPTGSTPHLTPDHNHHHHQHHQSLSSIVHSSPNASPVSLTCESSQSSTATVHHSSLPPSVMTTSTPNLPSYESHVALRGGPSKENKTKKSRFSLKKLLKFGSKDDHDDSKWKAKSLLLHGESSHHHERRTKLEILHPIDLIHGARNDNIPSSSLDKSSSGTSSSSKGSSIDSHQGSQTVADEIQSHMDSATDTEVHQGLVSSAVDDQPSSIRSKPPPPLRSRSSLDDPSKDKPSRPPPPSKRTHPLATGQGLSDSLENIHDSTPNRKSKVKSGGSLQHGDKRNSCYSTSMEYANLGDIRNNLAPKKPGRCVSSSMMDIAYTEQDSLNSSHRSTSNEDISKMKDNCLKSFTNKVEEVTYYEPPQDQSLERVQYDTLDELYADQCSVATNRTEPFYDGLYPAFVESSESVRSSSPSGVAHQTTHLEAEHPTGGSDGSDGCSKVYERVVLKRGNLEKVYSKFPVLGDSGNVFSTAVGDVDDTIPADVGAVFWPRRKSSRLSLRKAKTVVHKNLEDNYGAVVSANHQTLTQILEQVSVTQHTAASKIKLLEEVPPHWSDFKLLEDSQVTMIGDKAFYSAVWQQNVELTLMASQEPLCATSQSTRNPCVLVPIVEFEDAIPFSLFSKPSTHSDDGFCHGTVWVMERMRVETLNSIAESLHLQSQTDVEAYEREVCFILLQLINALKHLQVLGIEEVDSNCSDFILIMKSNDTNYRLAILPKPSSVSDGYRTQSSTIWKKLSLCRQALAVMFLLFEAEAPVPLKGLDHDRLQIPSRIPSCEAFQRIAEVLQQERATSLSQAKLLLEYLLWGPTDLNGEGRANHCGSVSGVLSDQEMAFQRWLDLERATVLNNLIRTQSLWQIRLTVFEEYMLSFLVRTCAKMLREAAHQLQTNKSKNS